MKRSSRIFALILSLVLILGYYFPIWRIDLQAPQYPEGLGMKIWINKLAGDINTINGLNHYIGMQKINESSIPELKYMPILLGIIIGLGLLVVSTGKKWLLYSWVFLFAVLGIAGAIDFYLWEFDYGHNLDPRAAIKIPDMYYQPPLVGSKELLNFVAYSYPDVGGWIIIGAGLAAILLAGYNLTFTRKIPAINMNSPFKKTITNPLLALLVLAGYFLSSCNTGPAPINYGKDVCDHCRMKIMDERFGAELVTQQGKIFKFDAFECLIRFHNELDEEKKQKVKLLLVANAANKGELIDVAQAIYLESENFPSPMGSNISAYSKEEEREKFQKEYNGNNLNCNAAKDRILKKEALTHIH